MDESKPKYRDIVLGLNDLTLGISLVVAVFIGVGLGYLLRWLFGVDWLLWVGVFFGVAAAILNIYKAYKHQQKELAELANDPKYRNYKPDDDEDEDD